MKKTQAALAAIATLFGTTIVMAADTPATNLGTTPGVQPQYQGGVPGSPGSSSYSPSQGETGVRPLPGEPGHIPGQSLAPSAGSDTLTTPDSGSATGTGGGNGSSRGG